MMIQRFLTSILNFFLYSNIFISLCALALAWQSFVLLEEEVDFWLMGTVYAATQCIYSLHRLMSLRKFQNRPPNDRFWLIQRIKPLLWGLFVLHVMLGAVCFFFLEWATQVALIAPAILSLGYVLPAFAGKRLRDLPFIKIFLIALVWANVTVILPWLESGRGLGSPLGLLFAERALFIFAITLPFDIRDLEIEKINKVDTIPGWLGVSATRYLSVGLLVIWLLLCFFCYPLFLFWGLLGVAVVTALLALFSSPKLPDYYYTLFVDGTMLLQGGVVVLGYLTV